MAQTVGASSVTKKLWFNSLSGHTLGFWVHSQYRHVQETANQCFSLTLFLSLSSSLTSSLSKSNDKMSSGEDTNK